jgi:hypothetical protein
MAIPVLAWLSPIDSPATVADGHILKNDLVTLSRKAPTSPAIAGAPAGQYFARFNDVDRVINPFVDNSSTPAADIPANTMYTFTDRGHMSLEGGVFELLPFSSGVSPATTVEYVDFAGTGHSPYPESYDQIGANGTEAGILLCGAKTNVEVSHTYTVGPQNVGSAVGDEYGTSASAWAAAAPGGTQTLARLTGGQFFSYFGAETVTAVFPLTLFNNGVGNSGTDSGNTGFIGATVNKLSENYTVGGTYNVGDSVSNPHTGSVLFELRNDTVATISDGNVKKSVTGTASWASGQGRTVTFTTADDHLLADANNRVYISGASNTAMNGLWNVATVTNSTVFTTTIFGAHCGPSAITSDVTIETYDGIDKAGGILRKSAGKITSIVRKRASVGGSSPATYNQYFEYIGAHGVAETGTVVINIDTTTSGTSSNFSGSVTRTSGTVLTTSTTNHAGSDNSTTTIWEGTATVFESSESITIIGGGVSGNNQVILDGEVSISSDVGYAFSGNSTSSEVSTIYFTGATDSTSMFHDAGFILDTNTGRIYTEGAPSTQPSGTDGMPGGFDPTTNPNGGVKEIDSWCPRYVHAKQKALDRADPSEQLKANTSGKFSLDQMINSPIVDADGLITTLLLPRHGFHEICWFTIRASKNPAHRRTPNTFVEGEDFIDRKFGIKVFTNTNSDRNEILLDYIDISNKDVVSNTDTSFTKTVGDDRVAITNKEHLTLGYANGTFKNN